MSPFAIHKFSETVGGIMKFNDTQFLRLKYASKEQEALLQNMFFFLRLLRRIPDSSSTINSSYLATSLQFSITRLSLLALCTAPKPFCPGEPKMVAEITSFLAWTSELLICGNHSIKNCQMHKKASVCDDGSRKYFFLLQKGECQDWICGHDSFTKNLFFLWAIATIWTGSELLKTATFI